MFPGDVLRPTAVQRAANVGDSEALLGASMSPATIGCVRAHRQGQQNEKTTHLLTTIIFSKKFNK